MRADRAEIWAGLKSPILAQQHIAKALGLPQKQVTVNVITGGGSFGHKLFGDHAIEAAKISKAMGKPVKLMWHRADEPRQGRVHPMATSRIRATLPRRPGAQLRAAQHQRGHRLQPRARRDASPSMLDELPAGLGNLGFSRDDLRR